MEKIVFSISLDKLGVYLLIVHMRFLNILSDVLCCIEE